MRINKGRSPAGTDRWMISWADLLTLLFASMVVLYASAARSHLRPESALPRESAPQVNDLAGPFERLTQLLGPEIARQEVQVSLTAHGIAISLRDQTYFMSGSADVEPGAMPSIKKIAAVIRELPNPVRLEGHSDSVPIHNGKFRDNFSLSAARSAAVLVLLESRFAVPSHRLAIAGYADNQPVAENESAEGRARNRRVDVVIVQQ